MNRDAIVLAGGRGRRLGGIDKGALVIAGTPLLERTVRAVAGARTVVVSARRCAGATGVTWTREDPPFAGPAAALAAGLEALHASGTPAPVTVVLAVDLLAPERAVDALWHRVRVDEAAGTDGWVACDPDGRRQPLLAIYRTDPLRRACETLSARGGLSGASMRALLAPLRLADVPLSADMTADIDTPAELEAATHAAATMGGNP